MSNLVIAPPAKPGEDGIFLTPEQYAKLLRATRRGVHKRALRQLEEIKRSVSRGQELQAMLDWHTGELKRLDA